MTTEYAIFSDTGLLEAGYFDRAAAEETRVRSYGDDPHSYVDEVCLMRGHDAEPRGNCELCHAAREDADIVPAMLGRW